MEAVIFILHRGKLLQNKEVKELTVVKIIELVGESKSSWEDAVQNAVFDASKSVDGITGVEIYNLTANIDSGKIVEYKANVKVAFGVKDR